LADVVSVTSIQRYQVSLNIKILLKHKSFNYTSITKCVTES
jgi:hypothetical protein